MPHQKFQPSTYSPLTYRSLARETFYGSTARLNGSAEDAGTILEGAAMVTAPIIQGIQAGQEQRMSDACGTAAGFKAKYDACKKANKAKGQPVYPQNPGKGPFPTDCREDYNKWQKYKAYCDSGGMVPGMTEFDATSVEEDTSGSMLPVVLVGGGLVLALGAAAYFLTQDESAA